MRPQRSLRSQYRNVFTETFNAGVITPTTGGVAAGVLACSFSSITQAASYSALFRRFKILHTTWMLIPRYTGADAGTAEYNGLVVGGSVGGWSSGRFLYAVDDTPGVNVPATELDMLGSNGVKIVQGMRRITVRNKPKPAVQSYTGALGSTMTFKTNPWLNTDCPSNSNSGTTINHFGVRYYFIQPVFSGTTPTPLAQYDIYCKVRFAVADPA